MNGRINRIVSAVLLLAMMFSIAACGKSTDKNTKKITADTPWYEAEIIDFKTELNPKKQVVTLDHYLAGADDKYIAVYTDGSYKVAVWDDSVKNEDWMIMRVTLIDRKTKQTAKVIDILDVLDKSAYPEYAAYSDGKIIVYAQAWDQEANVSKDTEFIIDAETGETISIYDYGPADFGFMAPSQYYVGDYRIEADRPDMMAGSSYYCLRIFSPDGSMKRVDIKDPNEGIYGLPVVLEIDEHTVLVPAEAERTTKFFKVDLVTGELTQVNADDYSWFDPDGFKSVFNSSDGNSYFTTAEGVSTIDLKSKAIKEYMNFGNAAVNMNYTQNLKIADLSEDKILLGGAYKSSDSFRSEFVSDFVIVELTKAKKNPHAGKTLLELYIPEYEMNAVISEAILKYNDKNRNSFIQVTNRYNKSEYWQDPGIGSSSDDYDAADVNAVAKMSYELAIDIMNGDGPDILMNTSGLGQLNNSRCLEDLSPYVADLDSKKYYTNIIDRARTDGKLYQLPLSYTIVGIQTDPEYAGSSAAGFTTEEYSKFLSETLNGKDLIRSGQNLYFTKLFNAMNDVFIKDGKVDLNCPEFFELAEYVKENVRNRKENTDSDDEGPRYFEDESELGRNRTAYYCNCPGISGYLVKKAQMRNATAILGIPSADGRGPLFGTDISVAVSVNAADKDACIDFVKMLMSDDVQHDMALNDRFVINRTEFRKGCEAAVEYYNSPEGSASAFDYSIGTDVTLPSKLHNEDIDNLERIILSCSKSDTSDAAIDMIIMEEMPAYFMGQKDLDAVIKIMQDRMQKVLDERG